MDNWIHPETKRKVLNLEYKEAEGSNNDLWVSASYLMPCGCNLFHTCLRKGFKSLDLKEQEKNRQQAHARIDYWFASYIEWHDCNRVSPEFPSGQIPIPERKSRVGPFAYIFIEAAQTA